VAFAAGEALSVEDAVAAEMHLERIS
jgi:hypothetical protein